MSNAKKAAAVAPPATPKAKRKRTPAEQAWFQQKVAELGKALRQLPADRRNQAVDILEKRDDN